MAQQVLAISGSLRHPSFTEKMLDLCLEGMGGEIEIKKFYPHKMNIGPCTSCWSCWGKKQPGVCVQKDDFEQILDAYKSADYIFFAAPLYVFDFPATVKNIIDRFFVLLDPAQIKTANGMTKHPMRLERHPKAVLISSCGFPEMENFDIMRQHFRIICDHLEWTWSGELLISASGVANAPRLFNRKYELIKKAGAELVQGRICQETTEEIAATVISAEDYRRLATLSFEGGIMAKAKMFAIAMNAMRNQKLSK